jgi:tellurite resistance protein TerC
VIWLWLGFLTLVFILLALDLGVFHRHAHRVELKEAAFWTIVWISIGMAFTGVVYLLYANDVAGVADASRTKVATGGEAAVLYVTGYLLEKSLSIDNIFVISLLFTSMRVPPEHQHRVLFWGILGAIIFRGAMIGGGVWFVNKFTWSFYVFGGLLLVSGVRMIFAGDDEDPEPEASWSFRTIRKVLPVAPGQHGSKFLIKVNGKTLVTSTLVALLAVELTDIVFAVDSVPAILGVTTDPFIVITSNIFAIMGLRSLYFVLAGMMNTFHHLKTALAILLIFIGAKMALHNHVHIHNLISLACVIGIVGIGVLASVLLPPAKPDPIDPDARETVHDREAREAGDQD